MSKLRPLLVFGTRPEAVKMAPVVLECARRGGEIETVVCHAGQHRELVEPVVEYFGIDPDVVLEVMRPGQTLAGLTARLLEELDGVLVRSRPDCMVAQGDTTTVAAAALAAFYRRVPLVHVEAGLRSGSIHSPWPEEFNRRVAGITAALHCAPTRRAAEALLAEGAAADTVHVTGNTVIDALLEARRRERADDRRWREKYALLGEREMVLVTGHRRESFGAGLESICHAVARLAERFAHIALVWAVHLNPNVHEPVHRLLAGRPNVHLIEPAAYPEFVWLMDRSRLILTDSGGVQEEAPSLGKPVLVMRDVTERPELIQLGAGRLVGTSCERIVETAAALLTDPAEYASCQIAENPYGDGHAAERIVDLMVQRIAARG